DSLGLVACELHGGDIKVASIIADRKFVIEAVSEISFGEKSLCEVGPEEFICHHAVIRGPIRVRTLHAYGAGDSVPTDSEKEMFVLGIVQRTNDGLLSSVVHGPQRYVVIELWVVQVACEIQHDTVKLEVSASVDGLRLPVMIHKRLARGELVQVSCD